MEAGSAAVGKWRKDSWRWDCGEDLSPPIVQLVHKQSFNNPRALLKDYEHEFARREYEGRLRRVEKWVLEERDSFLCLVYLLQQAQVADVSFEFQKRGIEQLLHCMWSLRGSFVKLREGRAERIESFRSCVPFVVLKAIEEVHHTSKQPAHLLKHLSRWLTIKIKKKKKEKGRRSLSSEEGKEKMVAAGKASVWDGEGHTLLFSSADAKAEVWANAIAELSSVHFDNVKNLSLLSVSNSPTLKSNYFFIY